MSNKTYQGIDVSHWQNDAGEIDYHRVARAGVKFVIIKAGGSDAGFYTDKCFEKNYTGATAAGLSVGAYYFTGRNFYGRESGKADAARFADIIKGKKFDYPVWVDIEATQPTRRDDATLAAIGFCDEMESRGYFCGIYASAVSGFKSRLNHEQLTDYAHWVAQYGKQLTDKDAQIWQYTSAGIVDGITGKVDLDISYVNYPAIIKKRHLNNY